MPALGSNERPRTARTSLVRSTNRGTPNRACVTPQMRLRKRRRLEIRKVSLRNSTSRARTLDAEQARVTAVVATGILAAAVIAIAVLVSAVLATAVDTSIGHTHPNPRRSLEAGQARQRSRASYTPPFTPLHPHLSIHTPPSKPFHPHPS